MENGLVNIDLTAPSTRDHVIVDACLQKTTQSKYVTSGDSVAIIDCADEKRGKGGNIWVTRLLRLTASVLVLN